MKQSCDVRRYEFRLPDLGEGMEEAQIVAWHVKLGSEVREGDPLLDVETDKATVQIPSPAGGPVLLLKGRAGDSIKTGTLLAVIGGGPEIGTAVAGEAEVARAQHPEPPVQEGRGEPVARDLPAGGAIPGLEIRPLPDFSCWGPVERQPLLSVRRQMARRTVTSALLIPHAAAMDEADITLLEEQRRQRNTVLAREGGQPLTLLPYLIQQAAVLLRRHPHFNASFDPFREELILKRYCHIRVTVATERGLLVPVVRAADTKGVEELGAEIRALSQKAGAGQLSPEELQGGTFTISSLGSRGARWAVPTIYYPESAILAVGRPQEQAVVRNGAIVARKMLPLTLAFDHRVADGAQASDFLAELARALGGEPS